MATPVPRCRICGETALEPILSLGELPAVNGFLEAPRPAPVAPLGLVFCAGCAHVQLTHMVDPAELFGEYVYLSGMSDTVVRWGEALAARYAAELALSPAHLVVELASNDGAVLKAFRRHARVLGVEPAANLARRAAAEGVPTLPVFFDGATGQALRAAEGAAALVLARNVVAHVPAVVDFLTGARRLLAPDGILHVEVPSVRRMLEGNAFDTIYHEHLSYFSVTALQRLFREAGLVLWDVEEIALHGGSVVARGRLEGPPRPSVGAHLAAEAEAGLGTAAPFHAFAARVRELLAHIPRFLHGLEGPLGGYGAAAKGVVLTTACGVGPPLLPWIADRNPLKQGRLTPGMFIPVVPPSRVLEEQPAHLVVLAWNLAEEIRAQLQPYVAAGGRLVVPLPTPRVLP